MPFQEAADSFAAEESTRVAFISESPDLLTWATRREGSSVEQERRERCSFAKGEVLRMADDGATAEHDEERVLASLRDNEALRCYALGAHGAKREACVAEVWTDPTNAQGVPSTVEGVPVERCDGRYGSMNLTAGHNESVPCGAYGCKCKYSPGVVCQ